MARPGCFRGPLPTTATPSPLSRREVVYGVTAHVRAARRRSTVPGMRRADLVVGEHYAYRPAAYSWRGAAPAEVVLVAADHPASVVKFTASFHNGEKSYRRGARAEVSNSMLVCRWEDWPVLAAEAQIEAAARRAESEAHAAARAAERACDPDRPFPDRYDVSDREVARDWRQAWVDDRDPRTPWETALREAFDRPAEFERARDALLLLPFGPRRDLAAAYVGVRGHAATAQGPLLVRDVFSDAARWPVLVRDRPTAPCRHRVGRPRPGVRRRLLRGP
jgi:hypothetical protein